MSDVLTGLVVGAAPAPGGEGHYNRLIRGAQFLVAADGGVLLCLDAGRTPDVCVGDFDSAPASVVERARSLGARIVRFPSDKNVSDLDLALQVCRDAGVGLIVFTAAFSGRLDHTLAALGTLDSAADLHGVADEPTWKAHAVGAGQALALAEPVGTLVSILSLGGAATVSTEGLRYPLTDGSVGALSALGISNVTSAVRQAVSVSEGTVLVLTGMTDSSATL